MRAAAAAITLLASLLGTSSIPAGTAPITHPIVFVQYPSPENLQAPIRGNLLRLDPDGSVHALTDRTDAAVRDPEVSWDGTQVVFSMRIGADTATWQVWEVGVDGTGLRKVSQDPAYNDLDPSYLPDGRLIFTTDRLRWSDGYENVPATQLAVMGSDGLNVEMLKVNPSGHSNPLVGSDGMVYLTQWDFHDRRTTMSDEEDETFDVNRFLLWKVFADGSGLDHPAFGAHTIGDFTPGYVEIRERPSAPGTFVGVLGSEDTQEVTSFSPDRLIFVPGTFLTFFGADIVLMQPQANQDLDQPVSLTSGDEMEGTWRSPLPLEDGRIVATFFPEEFEGEEPPAQLWMMNSDGSNKTLLHHQDSHWLIQPVEVVARTPPTLLDGQMRPEYPYALINALDVTLRSNDGQSHPAPGEVVAVRVLREDVRTPNDHDAQLDSGGSNVFQAWDDPDTVELGTAPVAPDGSFAVVVPADTPITWELLSSQGNVVVRERFGTELRAGEVRTCAGCHAPHDGTQGSTSNMALASPTNLSGQEVDLDNNGVVDLLENLCEVIPSACGTGVIFNDGFESGNTSAWNG